MTSLKIEISELALAKLRKQTTGVEGKLVATYPVGNIVTIFGCVAACDDEDYELYCPGGVSCWGTFVVSEKAANITDKGCCAALAINVNPTTGALSASYRGEDGKIDNNLKTDILTTAELAEKFFVIRCRAVLPASCELDESGIKTLVAKTIERLAESKFLGLEDSLKTVNKKKKYSSLKDMEILETLLAVNKSKPLGEVKAGQAIVIDYKKQTIKACWLDLCIDVLAMGQKTEPVEDLMKYIENSIVRNLKQQEDWLIKQLGTKVPVSQPEVFHFLLDHFLSVVYPKNRLDRELDEIRADLHSAFFLPTDRPLLMRGNAFTFTANQECKELINVHESVGPSNVAGGDPVLVQGRYAYHHYCQQGINDDGWGCAYRSLQTLCSWFKLQGYTNLPVPTLREIQLCLVNIGDKPVGFVDSSQWIGSTEVGFCLDTLLGIASRILNVSSGDELSMKGGELSHHFKTQGTPIMIGGGNLAHTILGVDYNKKTGDIKFLILDPHYTGNDDLNTIIAKGWCGWKGINFWKKGSFYNLCMPIRPKCI